MKRSALTRKTPLRPAVPTLASKPKMRKCAVCKKPFQVFNSMRDKWCSPDCGAQLGLKLVAMKKAKADREDTLARKVALNPRKWWLAKAKAAMHAFVRARDEGKSCISCPTILIKQARVGGNYDAGHFRSVGSAKHLEFDERNVHGQCKKCNRRKYGSPVEYERGLILRLGATAVEALKADQAPRQLTPSDLQEIETIYKAKLRELKAERKAIHHA